MVVYTYSTIIRYLDHPSSTSKSLLQDPGIMRLDLSIVVLVDCNLREPVSFIESFGTIIGHLHMEVDSPDFGLSVIFRGFQHQFKTLRPQTSRSVWLS